MDTPTGQVIKGIGKAVLGISVSVESGGLAGAMGGVALAMDGFVDIGLGLGKGVADDKTVNKINQVEGDIKTLANPVGLAVASATLGNLEAGKKAAAVSNLVGTAAGLANMGKGAATAVGVASTVIGVAEAPKDVKTLADKEKEEDEDNK